MNLFEARKIFAKHSGRYDLVDPQTFADNGANFFVLAGVRMLDRLCSISAHEAVHIQDVFRGSTIVYIPECSNIKEVYWVEEHTRDMLLPMIAGKLARNFGRFGKPYGYELVSTTAVPEIDLMDMPKDAAPSDVAEVSYRVYNQQAMKLIPKPSNTGTLIIKGTFYSQPLKEDNDQNIWTAKYPEILGAASLWALEVYYRNTEGANDWANFVRNQLAEIDQKEIEHQVSITVRMEG